MTQTLTRRTALAMTLAAGSAAAEAPLAPSGTLRAVWLASNPAQAIRNVVTGEIKGVSADLARELARRGKAELSLSSRPSPPAVIEAVRKGEADIGFVAPNSERMEGVAYSQPYMLAQQSFLVRADSEINSVADVDRADRTIGANAGDSVALYLTSWAKQAALKESRDVTLQEAARWLNDGVVDAFAGNRQRLGAALRGAKGLRLLPDNLYGVPQAIAVAADRTDLLPALNAAIDELRASGFLKNAIESSGVDGLAVAPAP